MKTLPSSALRQELATVLHAIRGGEAVSVTHYNQEVAVLISADEHRRLTDVAGDVSGHGLRGGMTREDADAVLGLPAYAQDELKLLRGPGYRVIYRAERQPSEGAVLIEAGLHSTPVRDAAWLPCDPVALVDAARDLLCCMTGGLCHEGVGWYAWVGSVGPKGATTRRVFGRGAAGGEGLHPTAHCAGLELFRWALLHRVTSEPKYRRRGPADSPPKAMRAPRAAQAWPHDARASEEQVSDLLPIGEL